MKNKEGCRKIYAEKGLLWLVLGFILDLAVISIAGADEELYTNTIMHPDRHGRLNRVWFLYGSNLFFFDYFSMPDHNIMCFVLREVRCRIFLVYKALMLQQVMRFL